MRRMMRSVLFSCLVLGLLAGVGQAQTPTAPYDHIHLGVPDPPAAAAWYEQHFGGRRLAEGPDRLMFGSTRLTFLKNDKPQPSTGSVVDHIGFSVANIESTMKTLESAGVKVTGPTREVAGLFKLAFVEDPWGTRIEVVEDAELLGLHHLHLRAPEPEELTTWLLAKFGGTRAQMKGRLPGIKYSAPGFSDVWVLVQKGDATPSEGHAIDHVSWRSTGPLAKFVDGLRTGGVPVTVEPREAKLPNGPAITVAFVTGPGGLKIELVERPGLKPGE
jgi:catechol 2,3-dioxygenase-like lactoylglutathione lyase family enzyme